jgi:hypothetical protein
VFDRSETAVQDCSGKEAEAIEQALDKVMLIWLVLVVKCCKIRKIFICKVCKFCMFLFNCMCVNLHQFRLKSIQNLPTLHCYILHVLQHFAINLAIFTNFNAAFLAVVIVFFLLA